MIMQPYPNPNYYTQYQTIRGKFVNSIEEITANDVPLDGNNAVFVKSDLSEIYVKKWLPNGIINTSVFVPKMGTNEPSIDDRLKDLEKKIASMEVKKNVKPNEPSAK